MIEFTKFSMFDIAKRIKPTSAISLEKLHIALYGFILKTGTSSPKKHGKYWSVNIADHRLYMDDYNSSIWIDDRHIGRSFGGFKTSINTKTYKYFVGLLYQLWLSNHKDK